MSTGVIITLIICGTIVLLSFMNTIDKEIASKRVKKSLDKLFDKEEK